MRRALACFFMAVTLLCSCKDGGNALLPKSGGRPYEVLVVAASDATGTLIKGVLTADAEGLPQSEPLLDVSMADSSRFNETARLARSIVIVTVNQQQFTATRVRYEKNVWAKPQLVVYVNTPSKETLRYDAPKIAPQLVNLLTRAEMNIAISALTKGGNREAEGKVNAMLGCAIKIPTSMKSSKQGDGFLWFSDNGTAAMSNVCVYSYTADEFNAERAIAVRDSVMRLNIQGERPTMFMQTVSQSVTSKLEKTKDGVMMRQQGLWEMRGDAMGGPFVSHSIIDSARHRIIVAEAFIYAPNMQKRNLMRAAEAALYTLKVGKRQTR